MANPKPPNLPMQFMLQYYCTLCFCFYGMSPSMNALFNSPPIDQPTHLDLLYKNRYLINPFSPSYQNQA
ncbi:hypothetical protein EPI10_029031 [Gossypium australe]|uniref:Uncharacterized protein n=1 Tax=Gossypium australe TaxID=47621 RepID=A0A5B6V0A7_9ROSI|nr:hypothetical protein EPI10_029031 [Gossypium australe]